MYVDFKNLKESASWADRFYLPLQQSPQLRKIEVRRLSSKPVSFTVTDSYQWLYELSFFLNFGVY